MRELCKSAQVDLENRPSFHLNAYQVLLQGLMILKIRTYIKLSRIGISMSVYKVIFLLQNRWSYSWVADRRLWKQSHKNSEEFRKARCGQSRSGFAKWWIPRLQTICSYVQTTCFRKLKTSKNQPDSCAGDPQIRRAIDDFLWRQEG